jgi:hypothetical protein
MIVTIFYLIVNNNIKKQLNLKVTTKSLNFEILANNDLVSEEWKLIAFLVLF